MVCSKNRHYKESIYNNTLDKEDNEVKENKNK